MRHQNFLSFIALCIMVPASTLAQAPVITSFSPPVAPVKSSLTITGSYFGSTPVDNIVRFGTVTAKVTSASTTQLTVEVPPGASYDPVSVTVSGLTGVSAGQFSTSFSSPGIGQFADYPDLSTSTDRAYSVTIDDMDGDGKPDVIIGFAYGNVAIFKNQTLVDGAISFGNASTRLDMNLGSANSAIYVATGDLDGDGKPELIATRFADGKVTVLRNISTPGGLDASSFAAGVDIEVTNPVNPVIADLDLDGKPEIVIPNAITDKLSVIRNTSTLGQIVPGSFYKTDFTVGSEVNAVAVADLDGDGKPDMAVSNSGENTLSILRNTTTVGTISASSFAARVTLTTLSGTATVKVGDLDGDGKPDVVAGLTNALENKITVHKNNCTPGTITAGTFATAFQLVTNYLPPQTVEIADLDGDSRPDLATLSNGYFSVFRNLSTSGILNVASFDTRKDYPAASVPNVMAIADLSGEGKADVVISDRDYYALHVKKNRSGYSPVIDSFLPTSARKGATVTITGQYFGSDMARTQLFFNDGSVQAAIISLTPTQIVTTVPTGAHTGLLSLFCDDLYGQSASNFTFIPPPVISNFSPASGREGAEVIVTGSGFDPVPANNILMIGSVVAQVTSSTASQIRFNIPHDAVTGNISIAVSTDQTVGGTLTIIPHPVITSFSPIEGPPGTTVTIQGEFFDPVPSRNLIKFNGVNATVTTSTGTSATVQVPTSATTGKITIQIDDVSGASATDFMVSIITGDLNFPRAGNADEEFSCYPNPTTKELKIGLEDYDKSKSIHLMVTDVSGRLLDQAFTAGGKQITFDVSVYPKGIYIIRVVCGTSAVAKHFVKE